MKRLLVLLSYEELHPDDIYLNAVVWRQPKSTQIPVQWQKKKKRSGSLLSRRRMILMAGLEPPHSRPIIPLGIRPTRFGRGSVRQRGWFGHRSLPRFPFLVGQEEIASDLKDKLLERERP